MQERQRISIEFTIFASMMEKEMKKESFELLAQNLQIMNDAFQQSASNAINKHITCRN